MEQGRTAREMKNPSEKKGHTEKVAKLSAGAGALCQIRINSAKFLLHSGDVLQTYYNYTQYCNLLHVLHQNYLRSKIEVDQLWDDKQALLELLQAKRFSIHSRTSSNLATANHLTITLKLVQPIQQCHSMLTYKVKASKDAPNSKKHCHWRRAPGGSRKK